VPDRVGNLTGLKNLWLNNNRIDQVPDWLVNLTGLTSLWLGSNRLEEQGDYLQRMFLKTQRQLQLQQEARCPSVFAVVPVKKKLTGSAYELRLYCEEPGAWHPRAVRTVRSTTPATVR
jgi:hypothetical protein